LVDDFLRGIWPFETGGTLTGGTLEKSWADAMNSCGAQAAMWRDEKSSPDV
jgi:hypothetical protein